MKNKLLIAVIGMILIAGCSTKTVEPEVTPTPEVLVVVAPTAGAEVASEPEVAPIIPEPVPEGRYLKVQREVRECALEFMDRQAHVMDATNACSHIYGLRNSRTQRTTDLDG